MKNSFSQRPRLEKKNLLKTLGFQTLSFFSRAKYLLIFSTRQLLGLAKRRFAPKLGLSLGPSLIAPREDRTTPFREVGTNPILDAQRVRVPPGVSSSSSDPWQPLGVGFFVKLTVLKMIKVRWEIYSGPTHPFTHTTPIYQNGD